MKRDKRLHPLSWGHHHGLVFASRLAAAVQREGKSLKTLVEETLAFWEDDLKRHFAAEETILLPALSGEECAASLARMLDEHALLRDLIERIGRSSDETERQTTLAAFAERLTRHIRFEERELFPQVEQALPEAIFDRVGEALSEALPPRTSPLPEL